MTPEGSFKKKVIRQLKKLDDCWFRCIDSKSQKGIPDIIGCKRDLFFALELKASKTHAEKQRDGHELQKYIIKEISSLGSLAYVTYPENWDTVWKELKEL